MADFDTSTACVNHVNRDGMVGLPDAFSGSALSFPGGTSLSERVGSSIRFDACFGLLCWVDVVVLVVGPGVWPKLLQECSSGLLGLEQWERSAA